MKKSVQTTGLLILTFVIGMAIGFLVNGIIISHRIDKMKSYYNNTGFSKKIMRVIKPTEEQRDTLSVVLRAYARENRELIGEYRKGQNELFEQHKIELQGILTEKQVQRLERHYKRQKRFIKNHSNKKNTRKKR